MSFDPAPSMCPPRLPSLFVLLAADATLCAARAARAAREARLRPLSAADPAAALAAVCGLAWRRGRPRTDPLRAGFVLWGMWLAVYPPTFS
ncbi:hypothetical protein ACWIG5_21935 [Streptomyces lydicus]